ncbi:ABC transporter ATP-binding protein [Virgisporangium ochraceum]|uniref:ABC transporter n=1 Tax=Virgisporangium ochraceum TaxID=65505 RepID=A0A8J4A6K3_9ACTN|nr:ABC transporter ATP-binding protein [Virgisporangium ochraceum]GIJ75457.1 ABC transporter [Virgisporangium ochraceum]
MGVDVIVAENLTKTYGGRRGLAGLDLVVRPGEVLGFLGPNGAGKTTTIRLLLDLIRPTAGTVRVLGLDPRADAVALNRRIGYLPGDLVVDSRHTVETCLGFLASLRGGAGRDRIGALAGRLGLERSAPIRSLSKGNRQKVGIVQAFMHEPELLILDEPTAGLDPLVQQTFLAMVGEAAARGATVFMSSHVLTEVEAVADRVAIIRDGRLVALDTFAALRASAVRRVDLTFTEPVDPAEFAGLPGVTDLHADGASLRCHLTGSPDALLRAATRHTVTGIVATEPALEDLFHSYYTGPEPIDAR